MELIYLRVGGQEIGRPFLDRPMADRMRTMKKLRSYERLVERVHNKEYDTNSPDIHCLISPEAVLAAFELHGNTTGVDKEGITCKTAAIFDNSAAFALEAQMSMVLTCFLIIAMGFGAFMIASDLSVMAEPMMHLMEIFTSINDELYRDYDPDWTWGGPLGKPKSPTGVDSNGNGSGGSGEQLTQYRENKIRLTKGLSVNKFGMYPMPSPPINPLYPGGGSRLTPGTTISDFRKAQAYLTPGSRNSSPTSSIASSVASSFRDTHLHPTPPPRRTSPLSGIRGAFASDSLVMLDRGPSPQSQFPPGTRAIVSSPRRRAPDGAGADAPIRHTLIHSYTIHSYTHTPYTHTLTQPYTIHQYTHTPYSIHSYTIHSFTHSLILSFTHTLIHSYSHSLVLSFTRTLICSAVR
jgi:hypothetical protein